MTEVAEGLTGLPPGWDWAGTKDCLVRKPLEDFKYAEIRYEPDSKWGHDYALYTVNRDGPRDEERKGKFDDLGKALVAGEKL